MTGVDRGTGLLDKTQGVVGGRVFTPHPGAPTHPRPPVNPPVNFIEI
jgi:hypothetical protein